MSCNRDKTNVTPDWVCEDTSSSELHVNYDHWPCEIQIWVCENTSNSEMLGRRNIYLLPHYRIWSDAMKRRHDPTQWQKWFYDLNLICLGDLEQHTRSKSDFVVFIRQEI